MSAATQLREAAEASAASTPDITPPPVHVAWQRVMDQVQAVGKTGHNKTQDYNFRGVDAVVNAVGPALRTHGVIVLPALKSIEYRDVEVGKNRTLMVSVRLEVRYVIVGPLGDVLEVPNEPDFGKVAAEAMDSGDKATSKAMSVAERTFLIQALMLPTHQPDPDEQTYERSAAREPEFVWTHGAVKARLVELLDGDKAAAKEAWTLGHGDDQEPSDVLADRLADEWRSNQPAAGSVTPGDPE